MEKNGYDISAECMALAAEDVKIEWITDMLARNGVQWPNRSNDIMDENALRMMWNRIIREHLAVKFAKDMN